MIETLIDRCQRLCGNRNDFCFIGNKKQVICIADMVINKVSGIKAIIDTAIETNKYKELSEILHEASQDIDDLINWVKFLQIAQDLRMLTSTYYENFTSKELRKEKRYLLPEIYQKYVMMEIVLSDTLVTVNLIDYSQNGIKFKSPVSLAVNSIYDCTLVAAHLLSKKVSFKVKVKHLSDHNGIFTVGAQIKKIGDRKSLNIFNKIHDFILETIEQEILDRK